MHLKENLRKYVASSASFIEISISAIVLVAIAISAVHIIGDAFKLVGDADIHETFSVFLHHALDLIVGVEFIKMLCRHSPGSTIEVLLFAIARQMIVEHTSPFENLITIATIALIFAIRKYLFVPTFGSDPKDKLPTPENAPAAKTAGNQTEKEPAVAGAAASGTTTAAAGAAAGAAFAAE